MGCLHKSVAVATEVFGADVVGNEENEVRAIVGVRCGSKQRNNSEKKSGEFYHESEEL